MGLRIAITLMSILMRTLFFILCITLTTAIHAKEKSLCIESYTQQSNIHIAKIDLSCPNLEFIGSSQEDKGKTVSEFAKKYQTEIAINANFFKKDYTPIGLTISQHKRWEKTRDTRSRSVFACTKQNKCFIEEKNQTAKLNPKWHIAISGWQYFNHKTAQFECSPQDKIGCTQDIYSGKHPRTMLGLDEKRNLLYLVVVEGRLLGFRGITLDELASIAQHLELTKAINLDGGGSSTFVVKDKRLSDLPFLQGEERKVSNHLGIKLVD